MTIEPSNIRTARATDPPPDNKLEESASGWRLQLGGASGRTLNFTAGGRLCGLAGFESVALVVATGAFGWTLL